MTDKYQQVLSLLETYQTVAEVNDALGWERGTTQHYIKRLLDFGYIEKMVNVTNPYPFRFRGLIKTLPENHLKNLKDIRTVSRAEVLQNDEKMNAIYNNYLFGTSSVPIADGHKIFAEDDERLQKAHIATNALKRSERKSPRVHVGCSFAIGNW